jgi:hypothetical protein
MSKKAKKLIARYRNIFSMFYSSGCCGQAGMGFNEK